MTLLDFEQIDTVVHSYDHSLFRNPVIYVWTCMSVVSYYFMSTYIEAFVFEPRIESASEQDQ